jgi:hypothetical protein
MKLTVISDENFLFFSNARLMEIKAFENYKETEFHSCDLNSIENLCIAGLRGMIDGNRNISLSQELKVEIVKNIQTEASKIKRIQDIIISTAYWFSKNFGENLLKNKITLLFLPKYQNVATSHSGGLLIFNENYLESSCDIIDWNYFEFILINGM